MKLYTINGAYKYSLRALLVFIIFIALILGIYIYYYPYYSTTSSIDALSPSNIDEFILNARTGNPGVQDAIAGALSKPHRHMATLALFLEAIGRLGESGSIYCSQLRLLEKAGLSDRRIVTSLAFAQASNCNDMSKLAQLEEGLTFADTQLDAIRYLGFLKEKAEDSAVQIVICFLESSEEDHRLRDACKSAFHSITGRDLSVFTNEKMRVLKRPSEPPQDRPGANTAKNETPETDATK
ncbi:MAG: hypothetical protein M5U26_26475 [Planctomycetota bacterium]|nr:hypothetical protein [Planctomycetota bacterium]